MRRRCPECGQPVKEGNLGDHVARVHPAVSRRKYRQMGIPAPRGAAGLAALRAPLAVLILAVVSNRHLARRAAAWERGQTGLVRNVAAVAMIVVGAVTILLV